MSCIYLINGGISSDRESFKVCYKNCMDYCTKHTSVIVHDLPIESSIFLPWDWQKMFSSLAFWFELVLGGRGCILYFSPLSVFPARENKKSESSSHTAQLSSYDTYNLRKYKTQTIPSSIQRRYIFCMHTFKMKMRLRLYYFWRSWESKQ